MTAKEFTLNVIRTIYESHILTVEESKLRFSKLGKNLNYQVCVFMQGRAGVGGMKLGLKAAP